MTSLNNCNGGSTTKSDRWFFWWFAKYCTVREYCTKKRQLQKKTAVTKKFNFLKKLKVGKNMFDVCPCLFVLTTYNVKLVALATVRYGLMIMSSSHISLLLSLNHSYKITILKLCRFENSSAISFYPMDALQVDISFISIQDVIDAKILPVSF